MTSELYVERLHEATEQDAIELGVLLQDLSERHAGGAVPLERLAAIIDSPDRDQFVARLQSRIVGSATLNIVLGTLGEKAWLEDFVVEDSPDVRGKGIGYALWKEIDEWCGERNLPLHFASHPRREAAHAFYERQGAVITGSALFRYEPKHH